MDYTAKMLVAGHKWNGERLPAIIGKPESIPARQNTSSQSNRELAKLAWIFTPGMTQPATGAGNR